MWVAHHLSYTELYVKVIYNCASTLLRRHNERDSV